MKEFDPKGLIFILFCTRIPPVKPKLEVKMLGAVSSIVIILSGSSASGKSSLQKELLGIMPTPFVKVGIDNLFDQVVADEINIGTPPENFDQYKIRSVTFGTQGEHPTVKLEIGPWGQRVIDGMIGAIKAYADAGNNVVVDYIQYDTSWTPKLRQALKNHKVYWVKVNIPLEVLEEREKDRGTSPVGHARAHYDTIHQGIVYDTEVDTSKLSPDKAAIAIKKYILKHPK